MSTTPLDAYRPEATDHLRDTWAGAHCQGTNMSTRRRTPAEIRDLKLRCVGCPAIQRCGEWAINQLTDRDDPDDIAAGMTRDERAQVRAIIKLRRKQAA